ncbi:RagB/SusD family nutrient uptake outer membrane protein [Sphingobacterium bovistauri]|uniref:RagB/SusD family nutrient uptake outer membrane protein n=1 Tax=Sphingobacterium bovistauri TaxID=2781959 RepID=A0ABS7Z6Y6_9SPHI|nr:RagB/SusD family nutrient uptake outer membrane protein [Sphingobacterium bovistauri]MCA5005917.1 RagB/SusD family nutrient uptake outer membrane protein [Sphingobacterium bovistauri]
MINKLKNKGLVLLFTLLIVMLSSCNKLLDAPNRSVAGEELHWKSMSETKAGLLGIYGLMRSALVSNNGHWVYGDVRGGDFSVYSRADLTAIKSNTLNASFPIVQNLSNWQRFYAVVNAASVFIERAPQVLENDNRYTEANLQADIAQAKVLRAFAYFYMVRIWGDVPLLTKSFDNGSFDAVKSNSAEEVLNYAEEQILSALESLPFQFGTQDNKYYGEDWNNWNKILINRVSAYAILAHISAWQGKYSNVDAYTKFIIDNSSKANVKNSNNLVGTWGGDDGLTGDYGIFSTNYGLGQLVAFSAAYWTAEATNSGHIEQLTLAQPIVNKEFPDIFVSKDSILNIYADLEDKRFGIDTISGLYREVFFEGFQNQIPIFKKIKIIRDGVSNGNYAVFGSSLIFTRYEEIVLLRAEALAILGNRNAAIDLLNGVKISRGLPAYSVLSTKPIIDEIFDERRRELIGEGWRFYDLVRYNKYVQKNASFNHLISTKGIYWPIASDILSRNPNLKQNEYWK